MLYLVGFLLDILLAALDIFAFRQRVGKAVNRLHHFRFRGVKVEITQDMLTTKKHPFFPHITERGFLSARPSPKLLRLLKHLPSPRIARTADTEVREIGIMNCLSVIGDAVHLLALHALLS